MRTILALTVMAILACLGFKASAQDTTAKAPDLEQAIDNGKLLDTEVDKDGVKWETYYDEEQNVMWSQTAGTPKDVALESMLAGGQWMTADDGEGGTLDFCVYQWLAPDTLTIGNALEQGQYVTYTEATYLGTCGTNCREYTFYGQQQWNNVGGWIQSIATTGFNQCGDDSEYYTSAYWDLDGPTVTWNNSPDQSYCVYYDPYWYYITYEDNDVAGEAAWDYGVVLDEETQVARHRNTACGTQRTVITNYTREL
jgi:hypothetical protein